MYGYIYRITDLTNGKCYIGQHKYDKPMLDPYYHGSSRILKKQIWKHPERFLEELLMICATLEEANYFETYFIEHMNTLYPFGYNLSTGGNGRHLCESTRKILSEKNKGRTVSEETKEKISKANKGKRPSEYTIQKMIESLKGHTVSEETKEKISKANKGKKRSPEICRQISERQKGKYNGENNPNLKYLITRDELYDLYVIQGLSTYAISKKYNCHQTTIVCKLKTFGIKGHIKEKPIIQLDIHGNIIQEFQSALNAAKFLNLPEKSAGIIRQCAQGKQKTAYGFCWKYK